jgi:hypothetical protein
MPRTAVLLAALLVAPSFRLAGQTQASVAEGDRVRLSVRHGTGKQQIVGRVTTVGRDTIIVAEDQGAPTAIPRAAIEKVEISRGQHGNAGRGALIGLGVGAIGGGVVGAIGASCNSSQEFCLFNTDAEIATGALVFGAMGTVVGAVIGALTRSDRWEVAPPGQ